MPLITTLGGGAGRSFGGVGGGAGAVAPPVYFAVGDGSNLYVTTLDPETLEVTDSGTVNHGPSIPSPATWNMTGVQRRAATDADGNLMVINSWKAALIAPDNTLIQQVQAPGTDMQSIVYGGGYAWIATSTNTKYYRWNLATNQISYLTWNSPFPYGSNTIGEYIDEFDNWILGGTNGNSAQSDVAYVQPSTGNVHRYNITYSRGVFGPGCYSSSNNRFYAAGQYSGYDGGASLAGFTATNVNTSFTQGFTTGSYMYGGTTWDEAKNHGVGWSFWDSAPNGPSRVFNSGMGTISSFNYSSFNGTQQGRTMTFGSGTRFGSFEPTTGYHYANHNISGPGFYGASAADFLAWETNATGTTISIVAVPPANFQGPSGQGGSPVAPTTQADKQ